MKIQLNWQERLYTVDLEKGIDLSSVYGDPSRAYRAWQTEPMRATPVRQGDWVGEVQQGAAINFFNLHLNPHGNGTHTEGFGHISPHRESVNDALRPFHGMATLVRFQLEVGPNQVIGLQDWQKRVGHLNTEAVIVHVPQGFPKDYSGTAAPFFSAELMDQLAQQGLRHFITNLPSVDPEEDGGALAAHKAFWCYPERPRQEAFITELAHIPIDLHEGVYFLNLQTAPLHNDACPSRPVVYRLE